jgi:phosphoribosylamine--glycine ligase
MLESGDFGSETTPVVIKADGLAAGKGVIVAKNRAEAIGACEEMESLVGSAAAQKIILEECLVGPEVSLLAFVDGEHFALMPPVRDHKRLGDGDSGPNTGGMGTVTGASLLTPEQTETIVETILRPTIHGCIRDGFPFRGVLFLGLMMTSSGPQVLEYNVRFGDPETQAILVRLNTDIVEICEALLAGRLNEIDLQWQPGSSACVILAAEGYPARPRTGDPINGLENAAQTPNVEIFHSGTAFAAQATNANAPGYLTAGGRVLGVTSAAADLSTALSSAYAAVGKISWPGMQYRKDIGKSV